jgi:uncharacterized protein (TIRG00374 family)
VAIDERERAGAHRTSRWRWVRRIVIVALAGAAVFAAVDKRHQLGQAAGLLGHLNWGWATVAVIFEGASLVAFARLQRWLLRAGGVRVGLGSMVEIIVAGNAMSMSLPGGAAWAAAWAFGQLRRRGADRLLAGWVVLVAGALASFALFTLLVVGSLIADGRGPVASFRGFLLGLAAIPVLAAAASFAARRFPGVQRAFSGAWRRAARTAGGERAEELLERFSGQVRAVQPTPLAWLEAFGFALLNWVETCACLAACILAVHAHVPWRGLLVAYSLTQVLASIPITPGGLGVVEGGLTALLVAYGMPTDQALASVLLFRIISFWGLVPFGWLAWGLLSLGARRGRTPRPHPWAMHLHRAPHAVDRGPRQGPERVMPPPPCEDCPPVPVTTSESAGD